MILTDNELTAIVEKTNNFSVPHLITSLAATVRSINDENGWEVPSWEKLPTKLMLIVTEADEAVKGHQGTGKDPIEEEFADIWIRTADILVSLKADWEPQSGVTQVVRSIRSEIDLQAVGSVYNPIEVEMWTFISQMTKATEAWRDNQVDVVLNVLEDTLYECHVVAANRGHDLILCIAKKLLKNRTRARLHGRARSDG